MTALLIIGLIVAGICWLGQAAVAIGSDEPVEKAVGIGSVLGTSFLIVVLALALAATA